MYPYDPLSYTGVRQLLAGPTIPGRSGASGQTKHSPATSLDHGAREENGLRPLRKTCGHSQRLGLITHSVVIEIDYRNRNHEYTTTPRSEQSRLS